MLREGWRYAELETKAVIVRSKNGPKLKTIVAVMYTLTNRAERNHLLKK